MLERVAMPVDDVLRRRRVRLWIPLVLLLLDAQPGLDELLLESQLVLLFGVWLISSSGIGLLLVLILHLNPLVAVKRRGVGGLGVAGQVVVLGGVHGPVERWRVRLLLLLWQIRLLVHDCSFQYNSMV